MNKKTASISSVLAGAIISSIIFLEGGYTNDPYDPGGQTKYGITEQTARSYGYTGDMKDLPLSVANDIYTILYIVDPHFDAFLTINPAIAHKLIDAGVNVGTSRSSLWLQQSLNIFSRDGIDYPLIREDGQIGKNTINAYKALERKRGKEVACSLVLKAVDSKQFNYYASLPHNTKYIIGWVNKRVGNIPISQCKDYNLTMPLQVSNYENQ